MNLTPAEAAYKRLALDTLRDHIAEIREHETEIERDLETGDTPPLLPLSWRRHADPLAPLAFNVIDHTTGTPTGLAPLPFTQPAGIHMPPLPTLEQAVARFDCHLLDVKTELKATGETPDVPTVTREAVTRLTTAERHVLQVHPFIGGLV